MGEHFEYTVIVPAKNAGGTLAACLESAINQTVTPAEIIVVDDGSDDSTSEIAQKYSVTLVKHETSKGSSHSRNAALNMVKTTFVAPLDADDLWDADFAQTLLDFWRTIPSGVIAVGALMRPFGDGNLDAWHKKVKSEVDENFSRLNAEAFWDGSPLFNSATIFHTERLRGIGGWPTPRYCEDFALLAKAWTTGWDIVKLGRPLGSYRLSLTQKSASIDSQALGQIEVLHRLTQSSRYLADSENKDFDALKFHVYLQVLARHTHRNSTHKEIPHPKTLGVNRISLNIAFWIISKPIVWNVTSEFWRVHVRFKSRN